MAKRSSNSRDRNPFSHQANRTLYSNLEYFREVTCRFLSCTPEHPNIFLNPAFQQETEYKSELITNKALRFMETHTPILIPYSQFPDSSLCKANVPNTRGTCRSWAFAKNCCYLYTGVKNQPQHMLKVSHPHCQVAAEVKGNRQLFRSTSSDLSAEGTIFNDLPWNTQLCLQ